MVTTFRGTTPMVVPEIQNAALAKMTAAPLWHPPSRATDTSATTEADLPDGVMYPAVARDNQVQGAEDVKDGTCMTGCSSNCQNHYGRPAMACDCRIRVFVWVI